MARIGEIVMGRPVDVVFDNVADQRNEPRYNLGMMRAAGTAPRSTRNLASGVTRSAAVWERRGQEPAMRAFDSDTRGPAPGRLPGLVPVALFFSGPAGSPRFVRAP